MQIRGEAAIACGFMAGLATGLLFDGCFDGYINRFRDSGYLRDRPQKATPTHQKVVAPDEARGADASKIKVIVTKNGKIYHRSAGCKTCPKTPSEQAYYWRPRSNEARRPVPYAAHQRPR